MAEAVLDHADAHDAHDAHEGHVHKTNTGMSNNKLAMWVFLGSECLLFGGLISTYLLYRHNIQDGPGPSEEFFDIPFTSASSFVLLMSSLTMVLAHSAAERGDQKRLKIWLLSTALLGSVFVSGQIYEFTVFVREGLGWSTSPFSSAFYALTGFHGVHVTIGIIMLLSTFISTLRGRMHPGNAETVEIVGLYWHFVDIVWVFIFTVIYLAA